MELQIYNISLTYKTAKSKSILIFIMKINENKVSLLNYLTQIIHFQINLSSIYELIFSLIVKHIETFKINRL